MASPFADLAARPGVPLALARLRTAALDNVRYDVTFDVPSTAEPITGRCVVRFTLRNPGDVVLDFVAIPGSMPRVRIGGASAHALVSSEHILIPRDVVTAGENVVEIEFTADDTVLNRQPAFLYSLFVPARARRAFPCFDQPDLKARVSLTLIVPEGWAAVSNAPVELETVYDGRRRVQFRQTPPLSTYLFAWVTGVMSVEEATRGDRTYRVWHREHDRELVAANVDACIDLHHASVSWLEGYTEIAYPFQKFDIVLVPSFQFSGMEHPGVIYYNAGRLLLEPSASEHEQLTRASLIAHETAHMWFGDLVTMRWFDDVWLKEVFANFMAEKIVATMFPAQHHELRFFLANYAAAYAVDRTDGSHPIRQPLDDLADAGHLYGPIIYLKAPIVFRQLELELGAAQFRDLVREYLDAHRFGNADWNDLLTRVVARAPHLRAWCAAWIDEPGRPTVAIERADGKSSRPSRLICRVEDPASRVRMWPQRLTVTIGHDGKTEHVPLVLRERATDVELPMSDHDFILCAGGGLGYARFVLDDTSRTWLLAHAHEIDDSLTRASAWMTLWDELLEGAIDPQALTTSLLEALTTEDELQNVERLLLFLSRVFWSFLSTTQRGSVATRIERTLRQRLEGAATIAERATWFAALRHVSLTQTGCEWLERVWRRQERVPGLTLGETDETTLALDLAVREVPAADGILSEQEQRIRDADRRARLQFLVPALSPEAASRERAFAHLRERRARAREPWALTALQYLNHPLRQAHARRFIRPGLELLPEIAHTGDIFFPMRWAEALLGGHASPPAAELVRQFLAEHPELPLRLRRIVIVAADTVFRSGRPPY